MTELHFKTSLGFSIPLFLCTLHKNLPALRGIYICITSWLLQSSSCVLSKWNGLLSLWIHQPVVQALLAGHIKLDHLCCDFRSQDWGFTCLVSQFLPWFGVSSKLNGHYHCRLWRHFKHLSKRDLKKPSTPAWACGVPPVRYLLQTQIRHWTLVCHLTTQSCSSVLLLI